MNIKDTKGMCCERCEKHVRDRGWIGSGSSRMSMTGVHVECKKPDCPCHAAPKEQAENRCPHGIMEPDCAICFPTQDRTAMGEWAEEYDEKFVIKSHAGTGLLRYTDADKIKAFIARLLLQAREENLLEGKRIGFEIGRKLGRTEGLREALSILAACPNHESCLTCRNLILQAIK